MATEVKWIKITVNMFDDEKIKLIQAMPEGDAILVVWIRLICLAGKCNSGGYIYFDVTLPYTEEMLATIFNKPVNIVRLAINTFIRFKMIEHDEQGIYLLNFEKHQNLEGLDRIRELTKQRVAKCREKKKLLSGIPENSNDFCNATVTEDNATDIDIERDKEKEIYNICPFIEIQNSFNTICTSLSRVQKMTSGRKNKLSKRWEEMPNIEQWKQLFTIAECTPFLKGINEKKWKASFDWLIKNDSNYTRVLEGQYGTQEGQADQKPNEEYQKLKASLDNGSS